MRPLQLRKAIVAAIRSKISAFVWGPPGIGKSQLTMQIAAELGYGLIDLRLSQLDPADIRGIPSIDTKKRLSLWNSPEFLPIEERDGEHGVLFFDELNSAHPATQTVAYQLILDGRVGNYVLPPGWVCIAAGNRMEDKAIVNRMSSALSNRFIHFDFEVYYEDWIQWANTAAILPEVVSFIRWKPQMLHQFDDADARSFPTPRTWEFVSKIIPHVVADLDLEYDCVSGLIGEGAATEFIAYNKIFSNLPDPDKILNDPDSVKVDTDDPAIMFAIAGSLSHRASEKTFEKILRYADRMPPEYQTILVRDSLHKVPDLRFNDHFKAWTRKNANVLL